MDEKRHDWLATQYDKISGEYSNYRVQSNKELEMLHNFSNKLPKGGKILDVGCGSGYPIHKILLEDDATFQITGIDFSEKQLEKAKISFPCVQYSKQDIRQIEFPSETFDGIISIYTMFNIPRDEHLDVLKSLYKLLKVGGSAMIQLGYRNMCVEDYYFKFLGEEHYVSCYGPDANVNLLKDAGFKDLVEVLIPNYNIDVDEKDLFVLASK